MDILQEIGRKEIRVQKIEEKKSDLYSQARCLLSKGFPVYAICNFGEKDLFVELVKEEKWTNETILVKIYGEILEVHKNNLKLIK